MKSPVRPEADTEAGLALVITGTSAHGNVQLARNIEHSTAGEP